VPKEFTKEELKLDPQFFEQVNVWLSRGDGIAVYENVELGHPHLGHRQFISYGGPAAQITSAEPPLRMPDLGNAINWRYQLVGTYKGEPLAV
jgi:hypothetical protein